MAVAKPRAGNKWGYPNLGVGVGLRTSHYGHILKEWPKVAWFEIISDNYMHTAGRPLAILERIAERYPVAMHGVSLSIGSTDPLNREYVWRLKALKERVHATWYSDHLCWTGVQGRNSHDLLPMPYTAESLRHVVRRVRQVQDMMEAPLLLENPSTYVEFTGSTMTEWEFLSALCAEADCGLMLDVNNIYVSSRNHGFDPMTYLAKLPWDRVVQMHVAGHTDNGTHCVDTHIGSVSDPVWLLFAEAYRCSDGASVLLEWDAEIPSFDEVHAEALRAHAYVQRGAIPKPTGIPRPVPRAAATATHSGKNKNRLASSLS